MTWRVPKDLECALRQASIWFHDRNPPDATCPYRAGINPDIAEPIDTHYSMDDFVALDPNFKPYLQQVLSPQSLGERGENVLASLAFWRGQYRKIHSTLSCDPGYMYVSEIVAINVGHFGGAFTEAEIFRLGMKRFMVKEVSADFSYVLDIGIHDINWTSTQMDYYFEGWRERYNTALAMGLSDKETVGFITGPLYAAPVRAEVRTPMDLA